MLNRSKVILLAFFLLSFCFPVYAGVGTEGAAFLNIPVGAGPAALGSAYSALAADAYAPTYNPGGLGFLPSTQLSGQHLSYLDSNHYEYLSFVHPLTHTLSPTSGGEGVRVRGAIGASVQYLGTGDITRTDIDSSGNFVNPGGTFSSHYAAYNLSYGQTLGEKLSLGLTGKWINAQIDDVSANAYAVDLGSMYKLQRHLTLAAVMTNLGSKLTFLNDGDSLPLAFHLGAAYQPNGHWNLGVEGIYRQTGLASGHVGLEWRPLELIALRTGYRSDTTKGLSALAGFTTGLGINVWGQELAYAWLPLGELGNTHYFSLVARFGQDEQAKGNLIQYQSIKRHRTVRERGDSPNRYRATEVKEDSSEPEYQRLMQILSIGEDAHLSQAPQEKLEKQP